MAKPETVFTNSVHAHLDREALYWMKNHNEYVSGIFDCWYSGKGEESADLWVEYKFIVIPKRDTTMIVPELSPLQMQWGVDRHQEGRNMAVIVGSKEGGVFLHPGQWGALSTRDFKEKLLSRQALADLITGMVNSA